MDFLQLALILLIIILGIFLSISGVQVFFILKDLKKALDRLNIEIGNGEIVEKINGVSLRVKQAKKTPTSPRRFFRRSL